MSVHRASGSWSHRINGAYDVVLRVPRVDVLPLGGLQFVHVLLGGPFSADSKHENMDVEQLRGEGGRRDWDDTLGDEQMRPPGPIHGSLGGFSL